MNITIIAAIARNNAIGYKNKLIYRLPDDLKRFKQLTTGHTIIMGRKTFESFPKGALPNRRNVVLTHRAGVTFPGAEVFSSLQNALESCQQDEDVYIVGGASVYKEAMPIAKRLYLTEIEDTPTDVDAFFPEVNKDEWIEVNRTEHPTDLKHSFRFAFVNYERRR